MDIMKINLNGRFMKGIVTKLVGKAIKDKAGYNVDIQLNDLEARADDGKIRVHVNADLELTYDEFVKILKSVGLD